MAQLMSVDLETTGLDPTRHEAWEIAIIPVDEFDGENPDIDTQPFHFHMPVTRIGAEADALEVGDFMRYEAPPHGMVREMITHQTVPLADALGAMHAKLSGQRLMGCAVHFDASFLSELFRRHGFFPAPWHHRHLDLGSYAGGHWGFGAPLSHTQMMERVPNPAEHTAFGDAQWNIEVWNLINTEKLEAKE